MKTTLLSFLILTIAAAGFFASCRKENSCEGCINGNKPPIAKAGNDTVIILPTDSTLLDGSLSTDPDGNITKWQWTKISGSGSVVISHSETAKAVAKDLTAGVYQFELVVTDNGGLPAKDTIQVAVNSSASRPPIANAGNDTTITLPANTVILDGSKSTDPDNNIVSYYWSKLSGPGTFNIANANALQTQAISLAEGMYLFELKVTDADGLTGKDTLQVMVQAFIVDIGVYAAGNNYDFVSGINSPFYWHNGTRIDLTTGGYASSIFVSGSDVFIAGSLGNKPCYWKNGQRTDLPISGISIEGWARSIFVSGMDVYVAGYTSNPSAYPNYSWPYTPCYWKNGVRTDLSPTPGTTSSIFVSGTDVYIAGDSLTSDYHTPGYWKNGQRTNLSNGGDATSIFVSGTDVYVAGYQDGKPCYWNNGLRTDLASGLHSPAMSIFVVKEDVYVAGTGFNSSSNAEVPCYWKNNQKTELSYSSDGGSATSLFVSGSDVYVGGGSFNVSSNTSTPCYWKNGQRKVIPGNGYLTSIFIRQ